MRTVFFIFSVLIVSGCSVRHPLSPDVREVVAKISEEQLPRSPRLERNKCMTKLHHIEVKQRSCVIRVRREELARQMAEQERIQRKSNRSEE